MRELSQNDEQSLAGLFWWLEKIEKGHEQNIKDYRHTSCGVN